MHVGCCNSGTRSKKSNMKPNAMFSRWMTISQFLCRGSDHVIRLPALIYRNRPGPEPWHLYKRKKMENHSLTCSTKTRQGGLQFANMISWAKKITTESSRPHHSLINQAPSSNIATKTKYIIAQASSWNHRHLHSCQHVHHP